MIPNKFTFSRLLNKCASLLAREEGRHIHTQIIQRGYESAVFVGSTLIDMYAKCGTMVDAQRAFSNMAVCDVITWNSMILGHVKCGQRLKALELSQQMQCEGALQDTVIMVGLLNACTSAATLQQGRCVHEQIL
jgi:pentatricopeptide repeat protein